MLAGLTGEFWAAIAGAVVGGAISASMQALQNRSAARRRAAESLERRQGLGHALRFKMIRIHTNLQTLHTNIEASLAEAAKSGLTGWGAMPPVANIPADVNFTSDELAMLLALRSD